MTEKEMPVEVYGRVKRGESYRVMEYRTASGPRFELYKVAQDKFVAPFDSLEEVDRFLYGE